ncbi:MAG: acyl-CoA dehydrogenase family protein [Pseudomonadota bacterium]
MVKTHSVVNQPPAFDYNLFDSDLALQNAVSELDAGWHTQALQTYGRLANNNLQSIGFDANVCKPVLRPHDRFGHRINQVDFHAAYHQLMNDAISAGMPSLPWKQRRPGAHVARSALVYMHNQAEQGTTCPTTMTFSAVPALQHQPDITQQWIEGVLSARYDSSNKPWYEKKGLTIGMAMTEKQGGSDVRANQSTARPVGVAGPGKPYYLTGHKWFCSAPMSDGFLVLAQTGHGLGCFLMPR